MSVLLLVPKAVVWAAALSIGVILLPLVFLAVFAERGKWQE